MSSASGSPHFPDDELDSMGEVSPNHAEFLPYAGRPVSPAPSFITAVVSPEDPAVAFRTHVLTTSHGSVETRLYGAAATKFGILTVGGVGGGFDSPGVDLYSRLGRHFAARTDPPVALLQVRFRCPNKLDDAVFDLGQGLAYLRTLGLTRFALVGHSFGGAVALRVAAKHNDVRAVVPISTQSYGAEVLTLGRPGRAVLFIHGDRDGVLPAAVSVKLYQQVPGNNKQLKVVSGAGHNLDEGSAPNELFTLTRRFLEAELGLRAP
jgi:hypothetical protein